jgi:AP-2 complex subunit sigma-1
MNRGKTRLAKWYAPYSDEEKVKLKGEVRGLPTTLLPEIYDIESAWLTG